MKKILSLLLVLALVAGFAAGCKENQKPDAYVPTGNGLTQDDNDTATLPGGEENQEQELSLAFYPDRTMNPYLSTDFTNRALFSLIYQGLFSVDREYQVTPVLCGSYSMSEDMRTYVFYPAQATFSDGTPLTVEDVWASLNAAFESDMYKGRFRHVRSIERTSDGGVIIKLATASENFPLLLDIPIVKASELEADRPLGTGPYRLDGDAGYYQLTRQNNWWMKTDMAVQAEIIPLVQATSAAQIRDEFEFADLGLVCADPGSDAYADFRCDYEVWEAENGMFLYLGCNMESRVFSNVEVRSALTHAIDRDLIVTECYRGFAHSATLPASPQFPYYNDTLAQRYGTDQLAFAQAVLDAGFKDYEVTLLVNKDDSLRLRVARYIAQMLEDCGLHVKLLELSGYYYNTTLKYNYYGEWDLHLGQTKLSANMDLSAFFSSSGTMRWGGMENGAIYALCTESLANSGNYLNLHQSVMEDGRMVPILFRTYAVYATRGLISDLTPSRDDIFHYDPGRTMEEIRIDYLAPEIIPNPPEEEEED